MGAQKKMLCKTHQMGLNKTLLFLLKKLFIIKGKAQKEVSMKRLFFILIATFSIIGNSFAYQLLSTKEYGKGDAKNQNITVRCTTDIGKNSSETCSLRRYVKCTDKDKKSCTRWQPWYDLRDGSAQYNTWQAAAAACCKKKGLR